MYERMDTMSQTIFLIEDHKELVDLTKKILEKRGFVIKDFQNGEDALVQLKKEPPDMIILDHYLPGKTGLQICHEIKSVEATKDIPILIITGQVLLKEPTGGDPALIKPDDFLFKPFEVEELVQKISQMLKNN